MTVPDAQRPVLPVAGDGPATVFAMWSAALAVVVGIAVTCLDPRPDAVAETTCILLFALGMSVAIAGLRRHYPHPRLGGCNVVTLVRAAAVATLFAGVIVPAAPTVPLFALAIATLALDGIDGHLARRAGLVSGFGARFDMEVDAALAATLALIAMRAGGDIHPLLAACLAVLGFARYAFVIAGYVAPSLTRPLPERFSRKVVCVIQIGVLAALLAPVPGDGWRGAAVVVATGLLAWSFARDLIWLRAPVRR